MSMLPSERIIEDAKEICANLKIKPFTPAQLLVISLIVGHEIDRLEASSSRHQERHGKV